MWHVGLAECDWKQAASAIFLTCVPISSCCGSHSNCLMLIGSCRLGIQHGGTGRRDAPHSLWIVHDRLEVHWGEASHDTGWACPGQACRRGSLTCFVCDRAVLLSLTRC